MSLASKVNVEEFAQKHGLNKDQSLTLKGLMLDFRIARLACLLNSEDWEEDQKRLDKSRSEADELTLTAYWDILDTMAAVATTNRSAAKE